MLKSSPPKGDHWDFEVKWDGYRIAVHIEHAGIRILTRNGHDWTHRFPTIKAAVEKLPITSAIIDGEAVVLAATRSTERGETGRQGVVSSTQAPPWSP